MENGADHFPSANFIYVMTKLMEFELNGSMLRRKSRLDLTHTLGSHVLIRCPFMGFIYLIYNNNPLILLIFARLNQLCAPKVIMQIKIPRNKQAEKRRRKKILTGPKAFPDRWLPYHPPSSHFFHFNQSIS